MIFTVEVLSQKLEGVMKRVLGSGGKNYFRLGGLERLFREGGI